MPSTPNFAIPYPCETDLINTTSLAAYTNAVEAALALVNTVSLKARLRPAATAKGSTAYVAGTPVLQTFNTIRLNIDNMFNPAAPSIFTVNTAGSYMVTMMASSNTASTNTSQRGEILLNGATVATGKTGTGNAGSQPSNPIFVQAFLPMLSVGNTLSARITVTGVGNDFTFSALSAVLVTFGGS